MSDIDLVRVHSRPVANAKALVQQGVDELAGEHDLSSEWRGDTLHFHRAGIEGQIHVTPSRIQLSATLGFLLKPLKGTLVDHIERTFSRLFGDPESGMSAGKPAPGVGKVTRRSSP